MRALVRCLVLCVASLAASRAASGDPLTNEELQALGTELQAGRLNDAGVRALRRHAEQNQHDYRALAMAGQALTATKDSAAALEEAVELLERARGLAPSIPEVIMAHAAALAKVARTSRDKDANREASSAYAAAVKLAPGSAEAYRQLALLRVDRGAAAAAAQAKALEFAKTAIKLAPTLSANYDAMADVLLASSAAGGRGAGAAGEADGGTASWANLTRSERKRLTKAVKASIALRPAGDEDATAAALSQYRLFRLVASHPDLEREGGDIDVELLGEAVHAIRAAARLRPAAYGTLAGKFAGFEEATRLQKEADRRSRLEREAMVEAMRAPFEQKRLEAEEDAAIEAERTLEAAAAAVAARATKEELRR